MGKNVQVDLKIDRHLSAPMYEYKCLSSLFDNCTHTAA